VASPVLPGSLDALLLVLWAFFSLVMLLRLLHGAAQLQRLRRGWRPGMLDGTAVLIAETTGPAVVGFTRLETVLPRWVLDFDVASRALLLQHEREHVRSGDPWLLLLATLARIAMPWNMALWWVVHRLRLAVEVDCDRRVLRAGADPRAYAALLLRVGERRTGRGLVWVSAFAEPRSFLERRIVAMLPGQRSSRALLSVAAVAGVAVIALVAACTQSAPASLLGVRESAASPPAIRVVTGHASPPRPAITGVRLIGATPPPTARKTPPRTVRGYRLP
jgi:beta-lactamase regulating signal transducer with metallopeptidase domain